MKGKRIKTVRRNKIKLGAAVFPAVLVFKIQNTNFNEQTKHKAQF